MVLPKDTTDLFIFNTNKPLPGKRFLICSFLLEYDNGPCFSNNRLTIGPTKISSLSKFPILIYRQSQMMPEMNFCNLWGPVAQNGIFSHKIDPERFERLTTEM